VSSFRLHVLRVRPDLAAVLALRDAAGSVDRKFKAVKMQLHGSCLAGGRRQVGRTQALLRACPAAAAACAAHTRVAAMAAADFSPPAKAGGAQQRHESGLACWCHGVKVIVLVPSCLAWHAGAMPAMVS
jgi:hypothetical protein